VTISPVVARPQPVTRDVGAARWRDDLLLVLPAWLVARVVVLGADAVVVYLHGRVPALRSVGLLGWDAAYYRQIAAQGYGSLSQSGVRFWPLTPVLARAVALTGLPVGLALLLVANVAALIFALVLVRLARAEHWPQRVVVALPWLAQLAPPAYVLVMGYAEGVGALFSVLAFLGLRTHRWSLAAAAGVLAGLSRPVGLLLAAPAAVEAARGWRAATGSDRLGRAAAILAPVIGTAAYLGYIGRRLGDPTLPYRVQQGRALHGPAANPISNLAHAARGTFHHNIGTGLHVPWIVLFVALLVVMIRLLPASYTIWALLTLLAALAGSNLDSSERYLWGAFPFVVVACMLLTRAARLWWAALAVTTSLLTAYALLAFTGSLVP